MSISWDLDEEGGIDSDELLGNIVLQDSHGNCIEERTIFLDTFFFALAEGFVAVADGGQASIEVFDESISIRFSRALDMIAIECSGRSVNFVYDEAVRDLINSYQSLSKRVGFPAGIQIYRDLNEVIAILSERP